MQLLQHEACEGSDLLSQLYRQNAFDLACEEAWNAQAYLEARGIPLDIALRTGVRYVAARSARHLHEPLRSWEERVLFPLLNAEGNVVASFEDGRVVAMWPITRGVYMSPGKHPGSRLVCLDGSGVHSTFLHPTRSSSSMTLLIVWQSWLPATFMRARSLPSWEQPCIQHGSQRYVLYCSPSETPIWAKTPTGR
jgi:hypothetical protein